MGMSFFEHINKIYNKQTYLDKYGDSVFGTGFILFVFFCIFMFFYIKINLEPIRANWNAEKCKPHIIPFAGLINRDPNKTIGETTKDNFTYCINGILEEVSQVFLKPIRYSLNISNTNFSKITESVQNIRKIKNYSTNQIKSIFTQIMNRFFNVILPVQFSLIKVKSIFQNRRCFSIRIIYCFRFLFCIKIFSWSIYSNDAYFLRNISSIHCFNVDFSLDLTTAAAASAFLLF